MNKFSKNEILRGLNRNFSFSPKRGLHTSSINSKQLICWGFLESFNKKFKPAYLLATLVTFYILLFIFLSFSQFDGLKTQMNDLGNVDQPIYNTTQGKFMITSNYYVDGKTSDIVRLGVHANYVFLFFVPIYFFLPNPKVLLFSQSVVIALGAVALYLLGRHLFKKDSWLPLVVPIAYLLNPMVHDVNLYDFHSVSVAMPIIIFAFLFLHIKKYFWFYLSLVILALTNEDMSLVVLMFGLYIFFVQKQRLRGIMVAGISLFYFILTVGVLMPFFAKSDNLVIVSRRYSYLGNGIFDIIKNLTLQPLRGIRYLISPLKITYIVTLLLPVLYLPLLTPSILFLSLPSVLINLLSLDPMTYYPFQYYHMAPILSFIFLATVFAINKIHPSKRGVVAGSLLVASVSLSFLLSPAPYSLVSSWEEFKVSEHAKKLEDVKKLIPQQASLSVQNNLGAHLSQREYVYTFPYEKERADFILLDVNDPYAKVRYFPRERSFYFITRLKPEEFERQVLEIFESENYGVEFYTEDGYLLFKKGDKRDKNTEAQEMFEKNLSRIKKRYEKYKF